MFFGLASVIASLLPHVNINGFNLFIAETND